VSIWNSILKGCIRGRDSFMGNIMSSISGVNSHMKYPITHAYIWTEKFNKCKFCNIVFDNIHIKKKQILNTAIRWVINLLPLQEYFSQRWQYVQEVIWHINIFDTWTRFKIKISSVSYDAENLIQFLYLQTLLFLNLTANKLFNKI